MKRVISILILCTMFVFMIAEAVSAEAAVLWTEDFSSKKENDWIWDADTTRFFIENGKLEGWAEAVVHQSNFLVDRGAPRRYKECSWKVECAALEDGGNDAEEHSMSIWFADYISPYGDPENCDGTISYNWGYTFEKKQLWLSCGFDNEGENYKPANYPLEGPYISVTVPDSEAPYIDGSGASTFTLGMRVSKGKISFYMNDKKYAEIDAFRGEFTCTQVGSPVLLFNGGLHCTFDNVIVATADYNLFNETADGGNNGGNGGNAGYDTVIVTDTDENGNIVTRVETRQNANVGTGTGVGTASATGDAAIIVFAVMIVALGSAIVVKKVTSDK